MAGVAEELADRWAMGGTVDLDAECRTMTLRALGRSILGVDLADRARLVAGTLRAGMKWAADRALRPVNPPHWLPTPAQRKARAAAAALYALATDVLSACRADPHCDAPLVRALLETTDPQTGRPLSDRAICDELVLFMLAGNDTTSTALGYALWALGRHPALQQRVADEAAALGDRRLTPGDVPRLRYTVQVLHEALRLCPPASAVGRMVLADIGVDGHRLSAGSFAVVDLRHPPRSRAVGGPPALRPRPVRPRALQRPRPVAIPAIRWRPAPVHR
jgi:cytochrome P450